MGTALVPWWLLIILLALASLAVAAFVVLPLYRWFRAGRVKSVVGEVTHSLQMPLPEFLLTRRRVLADRVANDPVILETINKLAAEPGASRQAIMQRAYKIAYDVVPSFNPAFYFRLGYWMARSFLRSLYKVRLGYQDDAALARLGGDVSLIFMLNHRSNIDYILSTYLTAQRSTMSYGVGEWARVFPIQPLMRAAGGYFLRRESDDPLYRHILKRYVQLATEAKVPHAIFPEGQLSRWGGLHEPRMGLLSYITENYNPATSPDIVIIPIGTNYDRVPEEATVIAQADKSFVNRGRWFVLRVGAGFMAKTAFELLIRWRRPFGYGCANFGTPISLNGWLRNNWIDWTSLDRTGRFDLLQRFGDHVMSHIAGLIPVLPAAALCAVLMDARDSVADTGDPALTEDDIAARMRDAWKRFGDAGAHIYLTGDDHDQAIRQAMETLRRRGALVRRDGRWRVPDKQWPWVNYCGNSVRHFLTGESAIAPRSAPHALE
jgi:glycerol-3-phosphate O-acyltransferase